MSQKPQSEMSFRPGKMSEGDEFILRELYEEINNLRAALDINVDGGPKARILELTTQNDNLQDEVNDLKAAQLINEANISKLQVTIQALAAKLDTEDVTNLDQDYLIQTNNNLF